MGFIFLISFNFSNIDSGNAYMLIIWKAKPRGSHETYFKPHFSIRAGGFYQFI